MYAHLRRHFGHRLEFGRIAWSPIHVGSVFGLSVVSCVEIGVGELYFYSSPGKQLFYIFFFRDVIVIILPGTADSVDVAEVSMSAKFTCRLRRCRRTSLASGCVDVVGQSTLVICILPGADTEVVSVFLLVEIFTFAFGMGIVAAC